MFIKKPDNLFETICRTNSRNLAKDENAEYRSLLEKKSGKMLFYLFKYYKGSDVCRPLVYISSLLPHSSAQITSGFCLSKLRACAAVEEPPADAVVDRGFTAQWNGSTMLFGDESPVPTYLDSLCNWKRGDSILEMVGEWVKEGERPKRILSRNPH